jgi:hypothetical protein
MSQADLLSSPIDASVYQYIVGIQIGSQTFSCCALKPDKSQVIKPSEFPNAMPGFTFLRLPYMTAVRCTRLKDSAFGHYYQRLFARAMKKMEARISGSSNFLVIRRKRTIDSSGTFQRHDILLG